MGRNKIEALVRAGLLAAVIGTAAYSPRPGPMPVGAMEQPASPAQLPTSVTEEIPKKSIPVEVRMLMRNYYLQEWRKSLPKDYEVSILDFGPARHSGVVLPEEGLKLRQMPTTQSEPAWYVKWLDWGQEISFRNLIFIFNKETGEEESWMVVDERTQQGTRWRCGPGWHRGQSRCFAAARIEDEELINLSAIAPPPAEDISFTKWPR